MSSVEIPNPQVQSILQHAERILLKPRLKPKERDEAKSALYFVISQSQRDHLFSSGIAFNLQRRIKASDSLFDLRNLFTEIRARLRHARPLYYDRARVEMLQRDVQYLRHRIQELETPKEVEHEPVELSKGEAESVVTLEGLKGKNILFAIMPYSEEFHDVWKGGIKRAAASTGLEPIRIDMINQSSEVTDDIVAATKRAKIVVIDVTHNNANVMFEAGYASALKRPHIVISQSTEFLCFDMQNIRTLLYKNSWQGIEELHTELQKFIKGTLAKKAKQT